MAGSRYDIAERIKLVGDFWCNLTNAEANQFEEFIQVHPTFARLRQVIIEMDAARAALQGGQTAREANLRAAVAEYHRIGDEIYHVSKQWYAELVANDPKPEPAEA